MMERPAPAPTIPNGRQTSVYASQLLNADGEAYKLSVTVDSASAQTVRMSISLQTLPKPLVPATPDHPIGSQAIGSSTVFNTSVEVSFGHTVVLGTTQPPNGSGRAGAASQTLILAVRAESHRPEGP